MHWLISRDHSTSYHISQHAGNEYEQIAYRHRYQYEQWLCIAVTFRSAAAHIVAERIQIDGRIKTQPQRGANALVQLTKFLCHVQHIGADI